jgi:hypothetical protein
VCSRQDPFGTLRQAGTGGEGARGEEGAGPLRGPRAPAAAAGRRHGRRPARRRGAQSPAGPPHAQCSRQATRRPHAFAARHPRAHATQAPWGLLPALAARDGTRTLRPLTGAARRRPQAPARPPRGRRAPVGAMATRARSTASGSTSCSGQHDAALYSELVRALRGEEGRPRPANPHAPPKRGASRGSIMNHPQKDEETVLFSFPVTGGNVPVARCAGPGRARDAPRRRRRAAAAAGGGGGAALPAAAAGTLRVRVGRRTRPRRGVGACSRPRPPAPAGAAGTAPRCGQRGLPRRGGGGGGGGPAAPPPPPAPAPPTPPHPFLRAPPPGGRTPRPRWARSCLRTAASARSCWRTWRCSTSTS